MPPEASHTLICIQSMNITAHVSRKTGKSTYCSGVPRRATKAPVPDCAMRCWGSTMYGARTAEAFGDAEDFCAAATAINQENQAKFKRALQGLHSSSGRADTVKLVQRAAGSAQ